MKPNQEYLNFISAKLDSLRKMDPTIGQHQPETYKMLSFEDQVGQTAMAYLKNKKKEQIEDDPLFPNRNTY